MHIKRNLVYYTVLAALMAGLVGCSTTKSKPTAPTANTTSGQRMGSGSGAMGNGAASGQASGDNLPVGADRIVYFDFDSFVIKPEYQGVVNQQANYLRAHPASHVTLEGNTDERGSREYNLALGQKRAEAVQRALVLIGVPSSQIESVSFGAEKPADTGHDEAAWAKNRRVEFHYR